MKENELFQHLKTNLIPDLETTNTTNKFCYYDCTSQEYNVQIELKCRCNNLYPDYLIEKIKYDKLIQHEKCRYVCSVGNDYIFSWDLHKVDTPEWKIEQHYKTTEFGNDEIIPKVVGYLPIDSAINISYILKN